MATVTSPHSADSLFEELRPIIDPDLGVSIVDLGMVYDLRITDEKVEVDMTLTSPGCPYGPLLISQVEHQITRLPDVEEVKINLIWEPPWTPDRMSEELKWAMDM